MSDYDIEKMRLMFVEAYRRRNANETLTPLEHQICQVIDVYPEYHDMLSHQGGVDKVYPDPRQNPFLKMSLHLSVLEQLSTNRPAGILQLYQQAITTAPPVWVEQQIASILFDMLSESMAQGCMPDDTIYLQRLRAHFRHSG